MKSAKRQQVEENEVQRKAAMSAADNGGVARDFTSKPVWEQSLNEEYKKPPTKKQLEENPSILYEGGYGSNYPLRLSEYHDKWLEFFEKTEKRSRQKMIDHIIDDYIQRRLPDLVSSYDDDEIISG